MLNKYYRLFLSVSFITLLASCSPKVAPPSVTPMPPAAAGEPAPAGPLPPFASTNLFYNTKADSLLSIAKQQLPALLCDSNGVEAFPSEWVGTVNFGLRKANYVVMHYTAQDSVQQTLKTFTLLRTEVSAHYVIAKTGKVFHMVNDYMRSNHAGVGRWGNVTDMNSGSLGIEIDNNGKEPFTDAQTKSLLLLLAQLKKTYNIPTANFIGHQDLAPRRKPDPGPLFPWKTLAENGFGYWSDVVVEPAPEGFDYVTALRLIGYDVTDVNAAVIAFKRHFVQGDSTAQMSQLDLNVLFNVYQKYIP